MEKLERYRELVQTALLTYVESRTGVSTREDLELQVVFDSTRDRYLLVYVGWYRDRRVYGTIVHVDIKEKVWLQLNNTEDDIAAELMAVGIPKEEIVLGFQAPEMRQFTEFAVR